jgi:hypothetical protein
VVLFKENHISGAGESREAGNPGEPRDDKGKGDTSMEIGRWTNAVGSACALNETTALSFVIPSEAEGSAV